MEADLLMQISSILNHTHAHRLLIKLSAKIGLDDDRQEEFVNRLEAFAEETMLELLDEQEQEAY